MPEALAGMSILIFIAILIASIILTVLWIILPFAVFGIRKELRKIADHLERESRGDTTLEGYSKFGKSAPGTRPTRREEEIRRKREESAKEKEVQRILEERKQEGTDA